MAAVTGADHSYPAGCASVLRGIRSAGRHHRLLAELIDLYVERDLPLEQTDSADLRILRNLFDPLVWYREDIARILAAQQRLMPLRGRFFVPSA